MNPINQHFHEDTMPTHHHERFAFDHAMARVDDAVNDALALLRTVQLDHYPDSKFIGVDELINEAIPMAADGRAARFSWLVCAMSHTVYLLYRCGLRPDGTYKWVGCRYGVQGHEYLSGWPSNSPV